MPHHAKVIVAACLIVGASVLTTRASRPNLPPRARAISSIQKIHEAVDNDNLTPDEGLVYRAMAVFDRAQLPTEFRSGALEKCGTPVLAEIEAKWSSLSPATRARLSRWPVAGAARGLTAALARPGFSGPERTLATEHFLIHYTLSGPDAVSLTDLNFNGVPDYIDAVADAMEYSRLVEVETLGWLEPPSDEPVEPFSPAYDVYVKDVGVEGLTYPEGVKGDNEHSPDIVELHARYSFIVLNNRLSRPVLNVAAAHEYAHAIQFGYNAAAEGFDERRWLMEGTATWMEDQVYDDVNDNVGYLPNLFAHPDRSLTHVDNHYASWLFFEYLEEHLGGQRVMRDIWTGSVPLIGDFSAEAIDLALAPRRSSLATAFTSFCVSNVLLQPCVPGAAPYCYADALLYLDQAGRAYVEGAVSLTHGETIYAPVDGVQPLSCDYVRVHSRASLVAAGGYTPSQLGGLQALWVGQKGWTTDALPFPIRPDPLPPDAEIAPAGYDDLYIVVANPRRPLDSGLTMTGYGLSFSVLDPSTPTPSPPPPTPSATPSPTPAKQGFRRFLPVILSQ